VAGKNNWKGIRPLHVITTCGHHYSSGKARQNLARLVNNGMPDLITSDLQFCLRYWTECGPVCTIAITKAGPGQNRAALESSET
jgi:hypothetical protein